MLPTLVSVIYDWVHSIIDQFIINIAFLYLTGKDLEKIENF